MHSCDYTGGAWFRSKNPEEEHVFFHPETLQLYKNNGPVSDIKLVSIANSKRGYYFSITYDSVNGNRRVGYSSPGSFWN